MKLLQIPRAVELLVEQGADPTPMGAPGGNFEMRTLCRNITEIQTWINLRGSTRNKTDIEW